MELLTRYLHIASAFLLVGELFYTTLWLRASLRSAREAGVTRYVLATMQLTSRGIAMPAMAINILTGVGLAFMRDVVWSRAIWLILTIILYTILGGLWHGTLIPMRKRMAALFERAGSGAGLPAEYEVMAGQWIRVSLAVIGLFVVILGLMVWRPTI